jgi:hypothetical protein
MKSWRLWVANGLALGAMTWVLSAGTQTKATELVPGFEHAELGDLAELEELASHSDPDAVRELAAAYLDRRQPGLSAAVVAQASEEVKQRPEILLLRARAEFQLGRPEVSLAVLDRAAGQCAASATCPAWVDVQIARHHAFVSEVVSAGIEDPAREPVATLAAYHRSTRQVGLVAMR